VLSYVIMALSYRNKFLPNTYINDIPVAGMTQEEAQQALLESVRADNLQFVTPKGEEVEFAADAFSAKYALSENALEETAVENSFTWPCKLFTRSDYTVTFDFSFSEDSLHKLIEDYDWGDEESQNACIVRSDDGTYEIQPETLGDQFDVNQLLTYAVSQIETGNTRIVMEDSGCYESYRAEIVSSDLTSQLALCNQYASCTITFDFSDRQKTIDGEMISEWVKMDEDGNIDFDTAAIAEFVAQMADETDTYGRDHSFYATLDGWITVPWTSSSIYGWQIDQTSTTEQILELLQAGESATVEPVYTNWGYAYSRATDDIGNTYVEVDISAQHVWYYKDGALVMDTDCVTGLQSDPERQTPCGIFKIWSHESPRKLGTYAVQGYETWVDYWMPVTYTGIGLHDLDRSAYGGNIYLTNGSHGCINLPHDFAASLFDSTVNGIPVIIHE
jgi:lipoprotein-anchoring transpeptidase ErfK/SrfK